MTTEDVLMIKQAVIDREDVPRFAEAMQAAERAGSEKLVLRPP